MVLTSVLRSLSFDSSQGSPVALLASNMVFLDFRRRSRSVLLDFFVSATAFSTTLLGVGSEVVSCVVFRPKILEDAMSCGKRL